MKKGVDKRRSEEKEAGVEVVEEERKERKLVAERGGRGNGEGGREREGMTGG
ncbi:hypothetical protein GJ598_25875, partial [Escherichia coli]|nr:hypothetical protein [Escherichia coli]